MNTTNFNDLTRDAQLSAWLDDELTAEERAQVEAWLSEHPDDAAAVRLWAADRDVLRARFDPSLEEPVPARLEQIVWSKSAPVESFGWKRLAAAVLVFVIGAGAGGAAVWQWLNRDVPTAASGSSNWENRAAVAHSVYVPEVRHPVEVAVTGVPADEAKAQEDHLSRWLTKRLGMPVKLFDLRAQGYELVGGRLLPDTVGPSAQLMYQRIGDAKAPRVTVYLRKPDDSTPASFKYERQDDFGMFYWVEGPTGYALVGALPKEQLLALADAIYKQGNK